MRAEPKIAVLDFHKGCNGHMAASGQNDQLGRVIAEAAFDPVKWENVCDQVGWDVGAKASIIIPFQQETVKISAPHSESIREGFRRYMEDGWYKQDVRVRGLPKLKDNGFITDKDCIAYDEVKRSPYYQDLLRAGGFQWFVGMGFGTQDSSWVITVQADLNRDPFTEDEIRKLLARRQQLDSAVAIARELGFQRVQGATDILEQQGRAVIAFDDAGRILHVSPKASALIGSAITISRSEVQAVHEVDKRPLERMIKSALQSMNGVLPMPTPVPVTHTPGLPPLIAYVVRLPEQQRGLLQSAILLLVFVDPEKPQNIPAELLMDYFGITRAEARLAVSALNGFSLEQHARDSAISIITARNHLQSLQSKTMTHSKAELVALLRRVVPF
jgi:DNA-binding CsgD family transcriptional regulator